MEHSEQLALTYLTGKELPTAAPEVVIPLSVRTALDFPSLRKYFDALPDPTGRADAPASITLAIVDSDSTVRVAAPAVLNRPAPSPPPLRWCFRASVFPGGP